ncbi:MurR/RpiR family transcriptional regulator [Rhizobium sp. NZLR3b]|uniref:MurR/RpiR family transcriptional regulator n=1 Tax=Rhizobium sp. NZLR3b TaxID=2731101 RepID=UPI001C83E29F|nr:MurR/RpiR family transcriptional regulator [Rhizobium sp. NZLR3b]MBX5193550.1 MurR/RpiR family transcriptional regulator [Rhizobium sp. NZLR3b]
MDRRLVDDGKEIHELVISKTFWAGFYRGVPEQMAALAKLACERPDLFAIESSSKLAERCSVSQTSVVRFAHQLGFDGFNQMKYAFQRGLREIGDHQR